MLTDEMMPALQGALPSQFVTCSADGIPNITVISQVYYVDPRHVALSFQFFSKSKKNVAENPRACAQIIHPATGDCYLLDLKYERTESEGPLFESMEMQLEAIASMSGMQDVFKLRGADVYEVLGAKRIEGMRIGR